MNEEKKSLNLQKGNLLILKDLIYFFNFSNFTPPLLSNKNEKLDGLTF